MSTFPSLHEVTEMMKIKYRGLVEAAYKEPPPGSNPERDGVPPEVFYLSQYEEAASEKAADAMPGQRGRLHIWMIRREAITELPEDYSLDAAEKEHYPNGREEDYRNVFEDGKLKLPPMFARYGIANFSYNEKLGLLEDSFQAGPLYGRGYVFMLGLDDDRKIKVVNSRTAWMS